MTHLDTLRKLAQAATPGPWYDAGCWTVHNAAHNEVAHPVDFENVAYIAACSPERILALLAVIEAAKAFSAKYRIINCTEQQTLDGMIVALEGDK